MKKILFAILTIALAVGCTKQDMFTDNPTEDLGDQIELKMSATISGVSLSTKALAVADENAISRLDVLVFKADNTFDYTVQATGVGGSGNTLTYTVILKKSNTKCKLVLLANLAATPNIIRGTIKNTALAAITFTPTTTWSAGGRIHMWAEYPTVAYITGSTNSTDFGTTTMIRSLARVNVTNAATGTFNLTKLHVYNSTNKACVVPDETKYNISGTIVTSPSIASGAGVIAAYSKTVTANSLQREIYIGESESKPVGNASAVCLVLEGKYAGVTHFYRVDMLATDRKTPLNILRNHTYDVKITKVTGPGYPNAAAAFASMPANLVADVVVNSDAAMTDITTDGQYILAVNKSSLDVVGAFYTGSIAYTTDYPSGVTATSQNAWITSVSTGASSVKFTVYDNSDTPRTGTITITAGRISKKITITQEAREVAYVGKFGGTLVGDDLNGWSFSKPLYAQINDAATGIAWHAVIGESIDNSETDGRANTWMLRNDIAFAAIDRCFAKNSTAQQTGADALLWYLPSKTQLSSIYVAHVGIRDVFGTYTYWSSSERIGTSTDIWAVNFSNGQCAPKKRTDLTASVRCVREL